MWPMILGSGLYTTCLGKRVLVDIRFTVNVPTFKIFLRKNVNLLLERYRKSNNVWLCALMQSHSLYSSLFFD